MPAELKKAFADVQPICDDAMVVSEGGKPKWSFQDFCNGIISGEIKNTERKYNKVFKKVKPVCKTFMENLTPTEDITEKAKVVIYFYNEVLVKR